MRELELSQAFRHQLPTLGAEFPAEERLVELLWAVRKAPDLGTAVRGLPKGVRGWPVHPSGSASFLILYKIEPKRIVVLGARRVPASIF